MTTRTVDDYAGLITPWQSTKARFVATVRANVAPYCDAQAVIASLPAAFDLDLAVGAQLDITGQWIGQARGVPIPLANIYFSADVHPGADEGYAQGPFGVSYGTSLLPDPYYRKLLYARVLYNRWDGTADGAATVLTTYFDDPATSVFLDDQSGNAPAPNYFSTDTVDAGADLGVGFTAQDPNAPPSTVTRLDMRWIYGFAGKIPAQVDLAILMAGFLPPRPMGAEVDLAVTTVDGAPLFGADLANAYISGADIGAIGAEPATVLSLLTAA
jgi:hypothetical protein